MLIIFLGGSVARALRTLKVISRICSFLGLGDNFRNSLVCSVWREPATDSIWRSVDFGFVGCLADGFFNGGGILVCHPFGSWSFILISRSLGS